MKFHEPINACTFMPKQEYTAVCRLWTRMQIKFNISGITKDLTSIVNTKDANF